MALIIDPPVGPNSPKKEIEKWIATLQNMPVSPERDRELERAQQWAGLNLSLAKKKK